LKLMDYHVHSSLSVDAEDDVEALCRRAAKLGIGELGIADHVDLDPADPGYGFYDYERAREVVGRARRKHAGIVNVRFGAEIGYQRHLEGEIRKLLDQVAYDYVIGSVHYAGGVDYSSAKQVRGPSERDGDEYLQAYFDELEAAARSGLFDVLGHLDVYRRYGGDGLTGELEARARERLLRVIEEAVRTGTGIEINTSGLFQDPGRTYPTPEIVSAYAELGGHTVTVGSDAHKAADVGRGIDLGARIARDAGFESLSAFEGRKAFEYCPWDRD